jgi:hypothetical protein
MPFCSPLGATGRLTQLVKATVTSEMKKTGPPVAQLPLQNAGVRIDGSWTKNDV